MIVFKKNCSHNWILLVLFPQDRTVYIIDSTAEKKLEALKTAEKKETLTHKIYYITEHFTE